MNIEVANRLVKLRKEKGLSQEALAEALGISRQAVSKWERAESSPDTDNLICLAKLYGISLDELLKTDDSIDEIKHEQLKSEFKESSDEDEDKEDDYIEQNKLAKTINSIFPIVAVVVFILLGVLKGLWHPGWVVFLLIPVVPSVFEAIAKKDFCAFNLPVFIAFVYVLFSSIFSLWHPLWVIFFLIPIYYGIFDHIKKKDNK